MDEQRMEEIVNRIKEEEVISLTEKLIEIESHKEVPQKESQVAYWIQNYFRDHGIESWTEEIYPNRPNVYARLGNPSPNLKSILFNGHIDTVPAYTMEEAFQPKREGKNLYGRGSVDMKGAIAAMMVAMTTIKNQCPDLPGEVIFAGVIDEEERAEGSVEMMATGEWKADLAIVGEPTELNIMPVHKGMEWIEVSFRGKASHGSIPHAGVNAIYHAVEFIRLVRERILPELEKRVHPLLGTPTLNLGKIKGGSDPNVVPDECKLEFDRRWLPGESTESIMEEFNQLFDIMRKDDSSLDVSMRRITESAGFHPPLNTAQDHWGVELLKEGIKFLFDRTAEVDVFPGWSDAAHLANGGIPSIVCGPGMLEDAHSSREKVEMKALAEAAKLYTYMAIKSTEEEVK